MQSEQTLSKQQKESVFLLQIGTFLEYFDLMLYVHMAVLLNELFFPPTDPKTASIITAFAFCSTYVLRPFGALIFGYIGDNYGRKPTVVITTTLMSISCLIMAVLPTYAQIGISAAVIVSILRIVQGMSSMGEIMGARIYLTEITKPPIQYPAVAYITISASLGSMMALGVATMSTRTGFEWRYAFFIGAFIAVVGAIARTKLRETPEFADAKRKRDKALSQAKEQGIKKAAELLLKGNKFLDEKLNIKSCGHFLAIYCGWPLSFYLIYVFFNPILKTTCGYSTADVILHNFIISIVNIFRTFFIAWLSYRIYPTYISKISACLFIIIVLIIPYILSEGGNNYLIFCIQSLLTIFTLSTTPADPIFIKHFPIFKRFTAVTFGYAVSRAIMYIIISFGLVYLTELFGYYGIWIIAFPLSYFFIKAIIYYEKIEKGIGNYPLKGEWQVKSKADVFDEI
jgi:MFS family permease